MEQTTHWKKLTNPNYLGSYSFNPNETKILTIKFVSQELVKNADGKDEMCMICKFIENEKPMILNKTNCKIISKLYETPYIEHWQGLMIEIEVKKIKAFGELVDALRVKQSRPRPKQSPQAEKYICTQCNLEIKAGKSNGEVITAYDIVYKTAGKCIKCFQEQLRNEENENENN